MTSLPLAAENAYLDLLERLRDDRVAALAREPGNYVAKTIKGRRYWYRQLQDPEKGRVQTSVGPETPELLQRIAQHQQLVTSERERRDLVRSLTRSGIMPSVPAVVGDVVAALAEAGVFRLRAVLVGTVAFGVYGPMLGVRFGQAALTTSDIDVAQFRSISLAVDDRVPPMLDVLRRVDAGFQPISKALWGLAPVSYASGRIKVEFLTPMRGKERDEPVALPALDTSSQALRFLDYLIYREREAALLYGPGVLVNVPDPARYAWHKLIVSQRRVVNREKGRKDIRQAELLFDALLGSGDGRADVRDMWDELAGPERVRWQEIALAGLADVRPAIRDRVLAEIGRSGG